MRTIPKRRHRDGKNIQPVPEIFAEKAFADFLFQITIGGGKGPIPYTRLRPLITWTITTTMAMTSRT